MVSKGYHAAPMDSAAPLLALAAAACFGSALIVTQFGLRHAPLIAGATVSVTFTLVAWCALSPLLLDLDGWHWGALGIFALVGVFYPAIVTLLTYESNRQLGPTLTGAVSCTAPFFAVATAVLVLDERLSLSTAAGGAVVVAGLMLITTRAPLRTAPGWCLVLPLSGAALRGIAQTLTKLGLLLWPAPFAAALVGYLTSAALMWAVQGTHARQRGERVTRIGILWFVAVGALNGAALLLMYYALSIGTVSTVSPIVATYPLFTMLFSAWFLGTESLSFKAVLGVILAIAGVGVIVTGR
jgi:drug/metabolite transporter (DMT)-like permease